MREHRAGNRDDGGPAIFDTGTAAEPGTSATWVAVRGRKAADQDSFSSPAAEARDGIAMVLVPPQVLTDYVVQRYTAGRAGADMDEFDSHFDLFKRTVFRLETKQVYAVGEENARIAAWRSGAPMPERSVRTSPWLRRVAFTTVTGKRWQRLHIVDHPLTDYLRYELVGYAESLAAGEEILIADRGASSELAELDDDFWLFDAGTQDAFALLMHYDTDGQYLGFERTSRPEELARCTGHQRIALQHAISLNAYIAAARKRQTH